MNEITVPEYMALHSDVKVQMCQLYIFQGLICLCTYVHVSHYSLVAFPVKYLHVNKSANINETNIYLCLFYIYTLFINMYLFHL